MASFKLNIARIRSCPPAKAVEEALSEYGLPESDEYGVLQFSATEDAVFGTIIRRTQTAIQRLDAENHEIMSEAIEKVSVYPFGIRPASEVLEVYAGSATSVEQVGNFLASGFALPTVVDPIEIDIPSAVDKLANNTSRFQLVSIRVGEYAHNSFMSGPYSPKFLDTLHGQDFLAEYAEFATTAKVRFQSQTGRATANITPKASFSYSCNEDDQPMVQSVLRKLI